MELVKKHALSDHVHLCLSIPLKFSVANAVGFLKGKSAIQIHRQYLPKDVWKSENLVLVTPTYVQGAPLHCGSVPSQLTRSLVP
ncbi:MAG: hypothetical protein A2289_26745 [Deltaproteobacteria bacterium RIFOXYA12_FULL_58_15]|nr:MAG: hypothetical protein A2289_26745 [Deltaproteobacteria bacterium RIFOXYA12_FULL_58_15]